RRDRTEVVTVPSAAGGKAKSRRLRRLWSRFDREPPADNLVVADIFVGHIRGLGRPQRGLGIPCRAYLVFLQRKLFGQPRLSAYRPRCRRHCSQFGFSGRVAELANLAYGDKAEGSGTIGIRCPSSRARVAGDRAAPLRPSRKMCAKTRAHA